jgi:hypothetical protein
MIFSDLKRLPKAENNRCPQDPMFNIAQDKKDSTVRAVPVRNTDLPVLARRSERHCDLGAYLRRRFQPQHALLLLSIQVPELTGSAGIKLNERISLRQFFELLTFSQSCGLARPSRTSPSHAYRAIRGRRFARGGGSAPECGEMCGHGGLLSKPRLELSAVPELTHSACIWLNERVWTGIVPRRSITGGLVFGQVWRRLDGRHRIYKKFAEYGRTAPNDARHR